MQKNQIDLTIAVPVYNVEKYLRRCLDSLVGQDYESREILIVNDGSTDNSLSICREYAEKYEYIRLINQENKGLAAVRNICIKEARGAYISFIDSDDYVLPGLYSHLMPMLIKDHTDIMCFGFIDNYEDRADCPDIHYSNDCEEKIKLFTAAEALDEMLLPNNIDVITCNKIFKKDLFKNISYPRDMLYEDMFTNYKVIASAEKICSTNYKFYVYCHRESSIGGMKFSEKTMNLVDAVNEVYEFAKIHGLEKPVHLNVGYTFWLVVVLNIMIRSGHKDKAYLKQTRAAVKKHFFEIWNDKYIGITRKIQLSLVLCPYMFYKAVYLRYLKTVRNKQ